jgi:lipopolysaccharide transport system permease protein
MSNSTALWTPDSPVQAFVSQYWRPLVGNSLILIGAFLVAVQLRLRIAMGSTLFAYDAQPPLAFIFILLSAVAGVVLLESVSKRLGPARRQFRALLVGIALSFGLIAVILPDVSQLQLLYYVLSACLMGFVLIGLPAKLLRSREHKHPDFIASLFMLRDKRLLLWTWVRNNIRARYSQTALGILWIVLLPLIQALILAFVFSQFVRMDVGGVPYISFYLAGLIVWNLFNQGVINSTTSLTNMLALMNQIYFPREILVLTKLGELIVDVTFTFVAMVVINLVVGITPNINWIYLPLLLLITLSLTLGIMFFLSYISVMVRDIPQLAFVVLQMLFYLSPILYPTNVIPPQFSFIVLINPLVPLLEAFRKVLVYNTPPDIISLYYPAVVAASALYLGYTFFKANERRLTDFI